MRKLLVLFGITFISTNVLASNSPVSLTLGQEGNLSVIKVHSEVNKVTIKDISVNRGNCSVTKGGLSGTDNGVTVFGESQSYYAPRCNVKEVVVYTDQGNWTFTLN
ncbi:hypothetical protein HYE53_04500 [Aggregatibacter actinomycetemcomitans]|uniref:hypothetical protein n=1 Tax=Aggregatibacter actinomycetemcomitans TaxID=714 RepID=UPI00197C5840|nr:hypothetical protein [Aggregatibacter actinomycetemcomitans]MBN6070362.1 hypothetical protein [Aggregatibacter actinomycetemcomitans]